MLFLRLIYKETSKKEEVTPVNNEEFAKRVNNIRTKLYKTALLYLGNETLVMDALDETVYKALCSYRKLRQPEYFDTWMTRILINECYNEQRRLARFRPLEEWQDVGEEALDHLPLKEAVRKLPKELKEVVILRYFADYTLAETAETLKIPQGTAATLWMDRRLPSPMLKFIQAI